MIVGVISVEKEKLVAYQLKGVSQTCFNQWKEGRLEDASPLDWKKFKCVFLYMLFPLEIREAKGLEFINY